ncbi:MAG: ferredoxin-type protein NapH [Thermoanaerobacterium sp.]|nr:ferredoxin-type protein NapH [Thermoanaerobacterium sp.]
MKKMYREVDRLGKFKIPIYMLVIFISISIGLWIWFDNVFYFFNFMYIGFLVSFGIFLLIKKYKYSRQVVQFGVGLYMLVYLGLICRENMQIEGFWYYLFMGVFQAAVIHYAVAKIIGPLLFGRGWCGYACWTAAVLDLLPYKIPENPRIKRLSFIRYMMFLASILFVSALFLLKVRNIEVVMFWSFIAGNIIYYAVGIVMALILKDNRAFCKYICPITVFLKPASYFSLLRVKTDSQKCISCGKCKKVCPMNVDILDSKRSRENGTECILCMECVKSCPKSAVYF